jgi:hypothetical protein
MRCPTLFKETFVLRALASVAFPSFFALSLTSSIALADEPASASSTSSSSREFGSRGMLAIDDLVGYESAPLPGIGGLGSLGFVGALGAYKWTSHSNPSNNDGSTTPSEVKITTLWLAPSLDWFVVDRVSIGGSIGVSNTHAEVSGGGQQDIFGAQIAPRVGYAVPLTRAIAFWPRIEGQYGFMLVGAQNASSSVAVRANGGFVFRAGENVMVDVGPYAQWRSTTQKESQLGPEGDSKVTQLGMRFTFGLLF